MNWYPHKERNYTAINQGTLRIAENYQEQAEKHKTDSLSLRLQEGINPATA